MADAKQAVTLMADDDENDYFFIKRAFQQARNLHPLQRVRDGEEAIEYLQGAGKYRDRDKFPLPNMMLLDLKMPRKNGFEVIEWVRQQPGLKRLPIIVFSSSRENPDVNRAYELGANTYLVKPVQLDNLVEMVESLNHFWLNYAEKPDISA